MLPDDTSPEIIKGPPPTAIRFEGDDKIYHFAKDENIFSEASKVFLAYNKRNAFSILERILNKSLDLTSLEKLRTEVFQMLDTLDPKHRIKFLNATNRMAEETDQMDSDRQLAAANTVYEIAVEAIRILLTRRQHV